jgi:hypothetical protein
MSDWMQARGDGWLGINKPGATDSVIDQWSWEAGRKANREFWAGGNGGSSSSGSSYSGSSSSSAASGLGSLFAYCIIGTFIGALIYGADAVFAGWLGGFLAFVAGFVFGGVAGTWMFDEPAVMAWLAGIAAGIASLVYGDCILVGATVALITTYAAAKLHRLIYFVIRLRFIAGFIATTGMLFGLVIAARAAHATHENYQKRFVSRFLWDTGVRAFHFVVPHAERAAGTGWGYAGNAINFVSDHVADTVSVCVAMVGVYILFRISERIFRTSRLAGFVALLVLAGGGVAAYRTLIAGRDLPSVGRTSGQWLIDQLGSLYGSKPDRPAQ